MKRPVKSLQQASAALLLLGTACAMMQPEPEPVAQPPVASAQAAPVPRPPFNPTAWVGGFAQARDCEIAAFYMKSSNPDSAWQALRACVETQTFNRGPLTQLRSVMQHWSAELATKSDAPRVIARLISNRGGDVTGDLTTLQKLRIPVFTLEAALKQPAVYKGRYIVVHASVADVAAETGDAAILTFNELTFGGIETISNDDGYGESAYGNNYVQGSGQETMVRNGQTSSMQRSGSFAMSGSSNQMLKTGRIVYQNSTMVTGRMALGRMPQVDPFLQAGREFVVLARFDGTHESDSGAALAVMTVVAYFHPAEQVTE